VKDKSSETAKKKPRFTLKNISRDLRELVWPRRGLLALGLLLIIVNRLAGLVLPGSTKYLIDEVVQKRNLEILHWGGRSSEWADHARISVAMYFQSRDVNLNDVDDTAATRETPLIFDQRLELSFRHRVRAIAAAIQVYRKRVRIDYPDLFQDLVAFSTNLVMPT
jgi:hypothetical protein